MATVKIYGAETSIYEYVKYSLECFLAKYKLDLQIIEIKDISQIIKDNVISIPTLRINSHVDIVYNEEDGIEKFVADSKENILHEFAPELLSKILVPIDFSDSSLNAFKYALALAKDIGGEIELLYVNHPSPIIIDGRVIVDELFIENQKYNLHKIIEKTRKELSRPEVDCEFVSLKATFLNGLAADEVIRLSKEKDLLVMGTTGESAAKKILGSVSLKVSGNAHCPALLIPSQMEYGGFKKIVYAYSPTTYDQKVIKDIVTLARLYNSKVHIVHVDDGSKFEPYDISAYVNHMFEDIEFVCQEIRADSVAFGISEYAEQVDANLIILSKKKKNIIEKILSKSGTKTTLMKSKLPVMVYHNDDHGCLCKGACKKQPDSTC